MRITAVEPIVHRADRVDTTRADGTQDAFLVRIHTDEGHIGIGEADTSPYLARTMIEMPSSHLIARGLRKVLVGENPLEIDRLWHVMYRATYHYGRGGVALHVISAIELVERLDELGIYWLEEPLAADDYEGYRRLSDAVSVRIAAGEADSGLPPYRALVE
jgi:L-alanine-DL-glutamate epimerase-like enolase superfamily enzyme